MLPSGTVRCLAGCIAIILTSMYRLRVKRLVVAGFIILGIALPSWGFSDSPRVAASSANISHSYKVKSTVVNGSIVSLDSVESDFIELANTDNAKRLLGVAVADNDSLLAFAEINGDIQVATSGNASVLVSDLNGPINIGDQIGVSPFNGIGMKVVPGGRVLGVAQTSLTDKAAQATSREVADKDGQKRQIKLGYVRVSISIGADTNAASSDKDANFLQKLGKSLTGKTVSTTRVLLSAVIALIALAALVTLIHAAIYGSLVSVGRNPLAKHAVFRALTYVLLMAFATLLIAGGTIFFLLR